MTHMPRIPTVPASSAGPLVRLSYWYMARRYGKVPEPFAVMAHSPAVFSVTARHELAVQRRWKAVDKHLVELVVLRSALTVECPWCVDFGSMLSAGTGLPREKVEQLPTWRTSDVYDEVERLALEYAEAMSSTPIAVTDEMVEALRRHLSDKQVVELTAYIALENTRARQNAALGIGSQGYSTGACAVPQSHAQQARQTV
jgi:AhpD family alkylhydroperoxidase